MSKLVDERVVELRFDNSNFEKNTRQSMSTIQKLKASLNFSGVSNSLNKSVNSVDMSPITVGLEKAGKSFSAWEVAAITAISNITNRIVDLGVQMVKSLSVDNIATGWEKFTQQTKSTGTIISQLSNTMSKAEASTITEEYMQKLMWYADATSYSLTDMTSSIAKMIAKGKDMDTSFKASVGIANWAASAGKNAAEAQGVFEALSKVSDHVLARQWYSIQAANMDTVEFKNKVLESAAAMGLLNKSAETFDGTIEYLTKQGHSVSIENFTDYFQDEWFTFDLLMDVLGDYGSSVEKVMDTQEKLGLTTADEAIEEFGNQCEKAKAEAEALGDAEGVAAAEADLFSLKQLKAAQEARTLEDAINAVKDAVSTGYLNIFEKIIGRYEDATKVFSVLSNRIIDIFLAPVDAINKSVDDWTLAGGRDDLFSTDTDNLGAIWNIIDGIKAFIDIVKEAWSEVFPVKKSLKDITKSLQEFSKKLILTGDNAKNVGNIFKGIFSVFSLGIKIFEGLKAAIDPIVKAITGDAGGVVKLLGDIGEKFSNWVNETQIFINIGSKIGDALSSIIALLKELKIVEKVTNIFKDFFKELNLAETANSVWKSLKGTFSSLFELLVYGLKEVLSFLAKYGIPAIAEIVKYLGTLVGIILDGLLKGICWLFDRMKEFFEYLQSNEDIQKLWTKFINFMKSVPDKLKKLGPFFANLANSMGEFFKVLWNGIVSMGVGLSKLINFQAIGDFFAWLGEKVSRAFISISESIKSFASTEAGKAADKAEKELAPLGTFFQGLVDLFTGFMTLVKAIIPLIGKVFSVIGAFFTFLGNSINKTFNGNISGGNGINLWFIITGGALALFLKWLYDFFFLFQGITSGIADIAYALAFNLRAKGVKQWAEAIRDIALSLLIVVGAILIITMIDPEKLKQATLVIVTIMAVLGVIMMLIGKFTKTYYNVSLDIAKKTKTTKSLGTMRTKGSGFAGVAQMILAFGAAVLLIVVALKMIDKIDKDKIVQDMAILLAIMVILGVSIGAMNAVANIGNKTKSPARGLKGILSFAIAMIILLYPLKKIGEMPLENIKKSLYAMAAILVAYGLAVRIMSGFKSKGIKGITVWAAAMAAMIAPIKMIGEMDVWSILKGVTVIQSLTLLFGLIVLLNKKVKPSVALTFMGSMLVWAGVMTVIAYLIKGPINDIEPTALAKFGGIIVGILAVLYAVYKILEVSKKKKTKKKDFKSVIQNIAMILGVLAVLLIVLYEVAKVSQVMQTVDWGAFGKYAAFLSLVMGAVVGIMFLAKYITKTNKQIVQLSKNLIVIGVVMHSIAVVSLILAGVAKIMDSVSWDGFWRTIILLTFAIAAVAGLIAAAKLIKADNNFMDNIYAMQSIMLGMSALMTSLAILTIAAGAVDWPTIGKVATLVLIAFAAIVGVVLLASKMKKDISTASVSLAKLGLAFALFGAGVALFAIAMKVLTANLPGLMVFIGVVLVMGVVMKILGSATSTMLMVAVAFGVMGAAALAIGAAFFLVVLALKELLPVLDELAAKSDSLMVVISSMVEGVITGIANAIPTLVSKILEALDLIIKNIIEKIKSLVQWFLNLDLNEVRVIIDKMVALLLMILIQTLAGINASIGIIVANIIDIFIQIIYAVAAKLNDLAHAIADFIIAFIDAIGQTIEDKAAEIRDCMIRFCQHMWNAFLNFFGIHSPSKKTEEGGKNIILGIVKGIGKNVLLVIKELVKMGKSMIKEIGKLPKQFLKTGKDILVQFLNGLIAMASKVNNFVLSFLNGLVDVVYNIVSKIIKIMSFGLIDLGGAETAKTFREAGQKTMLAYVDGQESVDMDINQAAKDITQQVVNELSKTDIYALIGEHIIEQIATGISDNSTTLAVEIANVLEETYDEVVEAYEEMAEDDTLTEAIDRIIQLLEDEVSDDMVLTPVIDTSEVEYGVGVIASLLSSVSGVTVASASVSAQKASDEMAETKAAQTAAATSNTVNSQKIEGQNGESYYVTFNITGPDPKTIADECAKVFYQNVQRRNINNGKY